MALAEAEVGRRAAEVRRLELAGRLIKGFRRAGWRETTGPGIVVANTVLPCPVGRDYPTTPAKDQASDVLAGRRPPSRRTPSGIDRTTQPSRHVHGDRCGHRAVPHDDHLDDLHNGHWRAPHDEHLNLDH